MVPYLPQFVQTALEVGSNHAHRQVSPQQGIFLLINTFSGTKQWTAEFGFAGWVSPAPTVHTILRSNENNCPEWANGKLSV
jgi:hypothetical protein